MLVKKRSAHSFRAACRLVAYGSAMDLWTRNSDRRYYWVGLERDLFGLVVVIAHGGRHRPPRVRAIPVWDAEEGERLIARIGARRRQHGYTLVEQDAGR